MANETKIETLDDLKGAIQDKVNEVAAEFKVDAPELTNEQIVSFTRQAFRQRCHTQTFQKKNRKVMSKVEELLAARGISMDELVKEAQDAND